MNKLGLDILFISVHSSVPLLARASPLNLASIYTHQIFWAISLVHILHSTCSGLLRHVSGRVCCGFSQVRGFYWSILKTSLKGDLVPPCDHRTRSRPGCPASSARHSPARDLVRFPRSSKFVRSPANPPGPLVEHPSGNHWLAQLGEEAGFVDSMKWNFSRRKDFLVSL